MKPTFKAQPMQVQVPATSANLGPGFDCLGLALNMHDRYMAQVMDEPGVDIDVTGEGADAVPTTDKNLVIKAMYKGFDFLGDGDEKSKKDGASILGGSVDGKGGSPQKSLAIKGPPKIISEKLEIASYQGVKVTDINVRPI